MVKKESDGYVKTPMSMVAEETKAATNGPLVFSIRQWQSTGGNRTFLRPLAFPLIQERIRALTVKLDVCAKN